MRLFLRSVPFSLYILVFSLEIVLQYSTYFSAKTSNVCTREKKFIDCYLILCSNTLLYANKNSKIEQHFCIYSTVLTNMELSYV